MEEQLVEVDLETKMIITVSVVVRFIEIVHHHIRKVELKGTLTRKVVDMVKLIVIMQTAIEAVLPVIRLILILNHTKIGILIEVESPGTTLHRIARNNIIVPVQQTVDGNDPLTTALLVMSEAAAQQTNNKEITTILKERRCVSRRLSLVHPQRLVQPFQLYTPKQSTVTNPMIETESETHVTKTTTRTTQKRIIVTAAISLMAGI
jgi:hypothetical protein